jgi:hypothetical protein
MTIGQILVSAGFVLAAAGTLFLSIDVFGFEREVIGVLNPLLHAEWLRQQGEDLSATAPNGIETEKEVAGMKLGEIFEIMQSAAIQARTNTGKIARDNTEEVAGTFAKHYGWIILSICLVLAGGVMTVIGDLVFHA